MANRLLAYDMLRERLKINMNPEQVSKIIRNRMIWSALLAAVVFAGSLDGLLNASSPSLLGAVVAGTAFILLAALCAVNARNYPRPHASYRRLNKLLYIDFMRIGTIFGMFGAGKNILEAGATRSLEHLEEAGIDALGSSVSYSNMKRGEIVEAYFAQLQKPPTTQPPAAPIVPGAAATMTAAAASVASAQRQTTVPLTVETPWLIVGLIGAFTPTVLVFLLVGALLSTAPLAGGIFFSSGASLLGVILGPLILVAPYILLILVLSLGLRSILKKQGVIQSGMLAAMILFSAGAIDIICLGLNLNFGLSELFVTTLGLFSALGFLYINELPYGSAKKWTQRGVIAVLFIITYVAARFYLVAHH